MGENMKKRRRIAVVLAIALVLAAIPWQNGGTVHATSYEDNLVQTFDLSSGAGLSQVQNVTFVKDGDETVAKFNGTGNNTSFLTLPNTAFSSVSASTGMTVSLWFKASSSAGEWSRLFDLGYSVFGSTSSFMFLTPDMKFSYNSSGSSWMSGEGAEVVCDLASDTLPEREVWNHAVVSLSESKISLYLNGNLVTEADNDNRKILNNLKTFSALDLGRSKFMADADYIGYMKNFQIYNTPLSDSDVVDLYRKNGGSGAISTPVPWEAHDMDVSKNSDSAIQFPSAPAPYTNDGNKRQNVHDPSMIKAGDYYYMYSTGITTNDVEIRRSKNLIDWTYVGAAGLMPAHSDVKSYVGSNLWAPEVIKYGDEYRMYYSCSGLNGGNSCIALATSSNPEGPFVHKGIVVSSTTAEWTAGGVNAIDANITYDTDGNMYMVWGSFFGGIKIAEMNASTGYLKSKDGTIIAKRSSSFDNGACEGPFVFYNAETEYYYLVVSYGNLMNIDGGAGGYSMRVGRSKNITGPYYDYNNVAMTDTSVADAGVGYKLATNYKFSSGTGWMAIGGNSVYEENGKWYCVAHARVNGQQDSVYVNIRQMFWSEDGWPLCNPSIYAGEEEQSIPVKYVPGKYERIQFAYTKEASAVTAKSMYLYPDYTASVNSTSGTWSYSGDNTITVNFGTTVEKYKIVPAWDWENNKATYTIMGIDTANGLQRWGKKVTYYDWIGAETPEPSPTATAGATEKPSPTATAGATEKPKPTATAGATEKPGPTATAGATEKPGPTATAGATEKPKPTATAGTTEKPKPTATAGATEKPKPTATAGATEKPKPTATVGATEKPKPTATVGATEKPKPTAATPSTEPTKSPDVQGDDQKELQGTKSLAEVSKTITSANTDKGDPKGSVFGALRAKGTGAKKAVKLSWTKVKGADGYIIYGSACGKKMKEITRVSANKKNYTVKKLKKGKYYKYIITAYKTVNGEARVLAQSKSVHVCTSGGKSGNPSKVTHKKTVTVKKGKTKKLKAKMKSTKKIKIHIAKFRYESTNAKIAAVDKKGKVKAKKKGTCYIYIYSQNGVYTKVKIKVK